MNAITCLSIWDYFVIFLIVDGNYDCCGVFSDGEQSRTWTSASSCFMLRTKELITFRWKQASYRHQTTCWCEHTAQLVFWSSSVSHFASLPFVAIVTWCCSSFLERNQVTQSVLTQLFIGLKFYIEIHLIKPCHLNVCYNSYYYY